MKFDFALILTALSALTGVIWLVDALFFAKSRRLMAREGEEVVEPVIVDYARSLFPVLFFVLALRSFVAEPFRIPSNSMMPTLLTGDFILVNKYNYGIRLPVLNNKVLAIGEPKRGDVMVFRFPGAFEGALHYVGNPDLISRSHFARFLVEQGICKDMGDVFHHYLTEGKPGFVPHRWASLEDAVGWIRGAGGIAVIAHPARYGFPPLQEDALFDQFCALGGEGVEVVTGSHTVAEASKYADMAREFGLAASRGSDFHSPQESRLDLGMLASLPADLTPVWDLLKDRIHG